MLKEIKILKNEKLKHDGINSLNKTIKRFKLGKRTFEIDLLIDGNTYDIFEVTDSELVIGSGFIKLSDSINFLKEEILKEE